jgi:hypothetical protein
MRVSRSRQVAFFYLSMGLGLVCACDGFNINISFVTPKTAEATETQTAALPAGAKLVVNNDNGSTRVTVDPAATQATMEITRIAKAEDQAVADDLLTKIVVTVTQPTADSNTLRIDAPRPADASDNEGDFDFTLTDDTLNITGVMPTRRVAVVKLVITLPPAFGVEATHKNGIIRVSRLDTASTLTMTNGSVRVLEATGAITVRNTNGDVDVRDHQGSLDARTDNGTLAIEVQTLAAGQQILGRTGNGHVSLDVLRDLNAQLGATADNGMVSFFASDFDLVSDLTQRRHSLTATLNSGGPTIDLAIDNGMVGIRGR